MQLFTNKQASRHRRQQVCASFVGLGLLTGVVGCALDVDSAAENAAQPTSAQPSPSPTDTAMETAAENNAPTEVDGRYSVTWTAEELTEQLSEVLGGADDPQAQQEAEDLGNGNAGTLELVLDGGRYDLIYVDFNNDSCPGTYVLDGDRIFARATTRPSEWDCGDGLGAVAIDATWTLTDDQLTLTDWHLPETEGMIHFLAVLLGSKPLERVAEDAEATDEP